MADSERLEAIVQRVAGLGAADMGIAGYFAGACLALRESLPAYSPRPAADATHENELIRAQRALAAGQPLPIEWLARFHFNNALHRLAALADRIVVAERPDLAGAPKAKVRRAERMRLFAPEVECIYQFVNRLKHDQHGSVPEPTFEMGTALSALGSLLDAWEHSKARRP